MKLPFDLGVKLLLRLIIPGFLITLGLLPAVQTLFERQGWHITTEYTLIISVMLMGWLIFALDIPIYMLFEGRQGWPSSLRSFFVGIEKGRLQEIIDDQTRYQKQDRPKYLEASFEKRKFPINEQGEYFAKYPTRLGNCIAAYESYPPLRYGMDSVFYWYRIWISLDKDLKEDIDNRSALADSAVYSSFALFFSSTCWFLYAIVSTYEPTALNHLPSSQTSLGIVALSLIAAYLIYRLSVHIHFRFGEIFKSLFDRFGKDVDISQVIAEIATITNDQSLTTLSRREQLQIAWRYLNYYRIKCPTCGESVMVTAFKQHHAEAHSKTITAPAVPAAQDSAPQHAVQPPNASSE